MTGTLTELVGKIDNSTIIVGDFNTPLSIKNIDRRTTRQKIRDKYLNNIIDQLDPTGIQNIPPNSVTVHMDPPPEQIMC